MKKLTLLLSAMLLACTTSLRAEVATLTFTQACGGSGTDDKANAWTVTSDAAESNFDSTKGIHYGTNKKAVSYLTLTNSTIAGTITKIVVNASGASETSAKLDVTVGGAAFGSQKNLTATATEYTFEGSAKGEIVVKLSQTSAKKALYVKSIAVTYSTATLQSIEIAGEPTKTTYMAGDAFSTDGLKVMGNYDDDTQKEITTGITWEVTPATLTAGLTSVEVKATVGEQSTTRTINGLTVTAAKTLTSIAVSGTPAEFWKGDTFHHDGMTVTATWDDASTTDVTAEAEFSTPDMTTEGTKTVTVTYKEKTTTYDITVKTIANTQETAYTVAEAIALIEAGKDLTSEVFVKGIVSEIVTPWSDQYKNITYNISDDGTTTSAQFQLFRCVTNGAKVGDAVVAMGVMKKYNSTTYEFDAGNTIVAIAEKVVTSIVISGEASKTNYYAGQTFNPEGLVVTATYEDKTTADVTELVEWTFDPAVLEEETTVVSVTATYKELNAAPMAVTVNVTAAPKIVTIDLTKDETTTATEDKLEWKGTVLTVTATKGTNTNANNYYPGTEGKSYTSTRFYKGATLTFTPADGITLISITYTATSEDYTSAMANSTWTNASTSKSGQTVTITPTDGTKAISAAIGGTTGGTSFVINYAGETTPTIVTNASFEPQSVKTIENGQLIILRDGKKYNAIGVRLQ